MVSGGVCAAGRGFREHGEPVVQGEGGNVLPAGLFVSGSAFEGDGEVRAYRKRKR